MPSQAEIEEFQTDLDVLTTLAVAEATAAVTATDDDDAEEAADILVEAYPELLVPFLSAAGELAADWYRQLTPRELPGQEPGAPELIVGAATRQALAAAAEFEPTVVDAPPREQLEASVRWALFAPTDLDARPVRSRLAGATQRYVSNSARQTLERNVSHEGARWARHASANACAFCRMLATRGAVYSSETAAGGDKYHDDCHCLPVPIRPGDSYQPPPYVTEWDRQYAAATREARGTRAVLAHMRAHSPASSR